MKREEIMKGGLNTLFGGSPESEESGQPQPEQQTIGAESRDHGNDADIIESIEDRDLKAALIKKRLEHRGRPVQGKPFKSQTKGYARMTTIVNESKMAKIREISLRETKTIKDIFEEMMDATIAQYEEQHGSLCGTSKQLSRQTTK